FQSTVIDNSSQIPVLVMFMGVWSEHCMAMDEKLISLAKEFAGQFIFAKVDIDEQQELRKQYKIENVPVLKIFNSRQVVGTEEGLMSDDELRAVLKPLGIFRESDQLREQAREKHIQGNTVEAVKLLTQAIQMDPKNTRVAMDMVQIFIDSNEVAQAESLFKRLPEKDKASDSGRLLQGQIMFKGLAAKTDGETRLLERLANNPDDHNAAFDLSICLIARNEYKDGIEKLIQIVKREPDYRDGAARELAISIINMLAPNEPELAATFRRQLGSLNS
ncbi:MAG: tetratricopeptide repeat protein, partial [Gammaproteobacteria bacterium]|nr:tetratricopeptide repeat protein [Gammaproteobacteria bacterium]